jgi:hypothetical protein
VLRTSVCLEIDRGCYDEASILSLFDFLCHLTVAGIFKINNTGYTFYGIFSFSVTWNQTMGTFSRI